MPETRELPALTGTPSQVAAAKKLRLEIFAENGVFPKVPVTEQEATELATELGIDPVYCGFLLRRQVDRTLHMASNLLKITSAEWWLQNELQARGLVQMVSREVAQDTVHAMKSPLVQESPDAGAAFTH